MADADVLDGEFKPLPARARNLHSLFTESSLSLRPQAVILFKLPGSAGRSSDPREEKRMKSQTLDLTRGSVPKTLLHFAWPMVLANLMQSVYGIVDLLIVGQFVGKEGLAGCSSGGSITNLLLMLGVGFALGGQLLIAQYSGMGAREQLEKIFGTTITTLAIAGAVVMTLGLTLAWPLLRLINTPEASMADAHSYLVLCLTGTIFIFVYNGICAGLRGMGDSKRPMLFVVLACCVNIALDLLFVAVFDWGVAGAAIATVIAQVAACIAAAAYLFVRRRAFHLELHARAFVPRAHLLGLLARTGIPCALQNSVIDIGIVILMGIINTFGVDASAGYSVGGRVTGMLAIPLFGVSGAASTMAGQNFGAGNFDRIRKCVFWSLGLTAGYALALALLLQLDAVGGALIRIFNSDPGVVAIGEEYMRIFSFGFVGIAALCSFAAAASGAGNTTITMIANLTDGLVGRMALVALAVYVFHGGLTGIFIASSLSPFLGMLVSGFYFFSGRWKTYQVDRSRRA